MPYKTGIWGIQAKERSLKRTKYFREYRRNHPNIYKSYGESMAYKGEELALKILIGSKRINRPCDLDWCGKLVDVKTAKPTKKTNGGFERWKFILSKQKGKVDLFLLICKDYNDQVVGIYLIPDKIIKYNNLSFSTNSGRYKNYLLSL